MSSQSDESQGLSIYVNRSDSEAMIRKLLENSESIFQTRSVQIQNNTLGRQLGLVISSTKWEKLSMLYLSGCWLEAKGVKYLSRTYMPRLKALGLEKNCVYDAGARHLTKMHALKLKHLELGFNHLTDFSVIQLLTKNDWRKMRALSLTYNSSGMEGIKSMLLSTVQSGFRLRAYSNQLKYYELGSFYKHYLAKFLVPAHLDIDMLLGDSSDDDYE